MSLDFDRRKMEQTAASLNFNRDTLEKVYRLVDVLDFISGNESMKDSLALKGGTAINLFYMDIPRLSVDIDLDFIRKCGSPDEVNKGREEITEALNQYMTRSGYSVNSQHSKNRFSIASTYYDYQNMGGVKDNIKVEINLSMRSPVFAPERKQIHCLPDADASQALVLSKYDIFAAKMNALLSRSAIRDLYDMNNAINKRIFSSREIETLRKSAVFYASLSQKETPLSFDLDAIEDFSLGDVKKGLLPVISRGEHVPLDVMKKNVREFFETVLQLTENEKLYLKEFSEKRYRPDLLFDEAEIVSRIKDHPMALWKMQDHDKDHVKTIKSSAESIKTDFDMDTAMQEIEDKKKSAPSRDKSKDDDNHPGK